MKITYRNCEISVSEEKALGGWTDVYWSAFSDDLYELTSGFGGGSVDEMVVAMKLEVDRFLDDFQGSPEKWDERQRF